MGTRAVMSTYDHDVNIREARVEIRGRALIPALNIEAVQYTFSQCNVQLYIITLYNKSNQPISGRVLFIIGLCRGPWNAES